MDWLNSLLDSPDPLVQDFYKVLIAILVGGFVGAEREYRNKSAGFRTLIFICVGSTLFTIFSVEIGIGISDPTRIAAQIVSGVGFLGAGVIMREGGKITGLTTAATIWLVAALGVGIGAGYGRFSMLVTAVLLVILWVFPFFERLIDHIAEVHTYIVKLRAGRSTERVEVLFAESYLSRVAVKKKKVDDNIVLEVRTEGRPKWHRKLVEELLVHEDVAAFE
jgi:putative Mg2+ transporter-C (MgtC) family protein